MYVLDLGCGWGGLSLRLIEKYGCKVHAITLSEEQFKHVTALAKSKKLESSLTVQLIDYRVLDKYLDGPFILFSYLSILIAIFLQDQGI